MKRFFGETLSNENYPNSFKINKHKEKENVSEKSGEFDIDADF